MDESMSHSELGVRGGGAAPSPGPLRLPGQASDASLLPPDAPLEMPDQSFAARRAPMLRGATKGAWVARASLFAGAGLVTAAFAHELYGVISFAQTTPIQLVFLVLATISFGWIAVGTLSAAMGFLPLFAGESADTLPIPPETSPLKSRTALLFPVHHEDPAVIAGTIGAIAEELGALGKSAAFDVFVLSDTRGADEGEAEEAAYRELRHGLSGQMQVYYRRRVENTARKSGNIKDWVERFGAGYDFFVILDGDSVMSGTTLVRLAAAMEQDAAAGLIQTVPRLAGGATLLQKLMQFASNTYGPAVAAGLAGWHRSQGNYWGHNAIIRTAAFAGAAGLPELPGPPPFGGHILSHDFVEAVLLQRAGWGVHMAPCLDGSFEGTPPAIADHIVRDRRWAQGNLQHLAILSAPGLTGMGRAHLAMGAFSYIVSVVWAASLAVGLVLALQGRQMLPSYFLDSKTLFPIWPVIDPGAAMRLFLATMAVVLLPKALGLALEIKRSSRAREVFGWPRAIAGVMVETVFSMLIAPIFMMTQTAAVVQIAFGRDSGWKRQRREAAALPLKDAIAHHWRHAVCGLFMAVLAWEASPGLLIWMSPVVLGLVLSGAVNWLTAKPAGPALSVLLSTPEERSPPSILLRVRRHRAAWAERLASITAPGPDPGLKRAA